MPRLLPQAPAPPNAGSWCWPGAAAAGATSINAMADSARVTLVALYGPERGAQVRTAETVMISEYGRPLPAAQYRDLFPFLP